MTVRFCYLLLFGTVLPILDAVFHTVTYHILLLFGHCPLLVTKLDNVCQKSVIFGGIVCDGRFAPLFQVNLGKNNVNLVPVMLL